MGEVGVFSKIEDLDKNCFVPMTTGNMKKSEDDVQKFNYLFIFYFCKNKGSVIFYSPWKSIYDRAKNLPDKQFGNIFFLGTKNNIFLLDKK